MSNYEDFKKATTDKRGTIEIATQTEVDNGTDTEKAITPATMKDAATISGSSGLFSDGLFSS